MKLREIHMQKRGADQLPYVRQEVSIALHRLLERYDLKRSSTNGSERSLLGDGEFWECIMFDCELTSIAGWGNEHDNPQDYLPAELRFKGAKKAINEYLESLVAAGRYVFVPPANLFNKWSHQLVGGLFKIDMAAATKAELDKQLEHGWREKVAPAGSSGPAQRPILSFMVSADKRS
jgi:hypothetical protein